MYSSTTDKTLIARPPGNGTVFDSDLMTKAGSDNLAWDENGQLTTGPASQSLAYNFDGKLRNVSVDGNSVSIKYDPAGNRIQKNSTINGNHKYIVDVVSDIPKVLLVLDANNDNTILKTYIHTDTEVLAQHDGDYNADRYFYLHDRLGRVRMVIDDTSAG
ncbi:MAG: hypothetical protein WC476_07675, partial [Phycisphaerae bacterium]